MNFPNFRPIWGVQMSITTACFRRWRNYNINCLLSEATEMIKVFGCLPVIETLEFGRRFVKFLTVANVPERLPFTLDHLKILELNTLCLGEIADVSFALCLIKSSPNLKNFAMEVFPSDDATRPTDLEFLEMQDYSNVSLN
ncbi:F-box/FBD/LRR-repeat protein At1g13570-like isoform X2 [Cornus florida]|uniref:F-box/FBD/LRR-repeat protein At1g13570-like isoform X2 n=1 Tax=Cornus florida TaxID=4283 RepID=UPI00289FA3B2|nr:F-box/FBD/LRR-repeat protein At1g13570-like isoform X2 [Cornus florida]